MNDRGVSAVIATVLLILITIAAIAIFWVFILPMVSNLSGINQLVDLRIIQEEYTAWDSNSRIAEVQVTRGSDDAEISGFDLVFVFDDGNSVTHFVNENLEENNKRVYYLNFTGYSDGDLETIKLAPVFKNGKRGHVTSELKIDMIKKKDLSDIPSDKIEKPNKGIVDNNNLSFGTCEESCQTNWCGTHMICGVDNDCGSCSNGYDCVDGICTGETNGCGDGTCNWAETCSTCEEDCGACEGSECTLSNNCFYVSVSGAGTHNGELGNEMNLNEAMNYANSNINENLIFKLNDGLYGSFVFTSLNRTGTVEFKSLNSHGAVFSNILFGEENNIKKYKTILNGISIFMNPAVKPTPTGDWIGGYSLGFIINSEEVTIKNSVLKGFDKYVVDGLDVKNSDKFSFINNDVSLVRGMTPRISNQEDNLIEENVIHNVASGSFIAIQAGNKNTQVRNNIIYDCNYNSGDLYFPINTIGTSQWHPGTAIAIRSSDTQIVNNSIHDCHNAQSIMTYTDDKAIIYNYSNILISNNIFYDNGAGTTTVRLLNLNPSSSRPVIIENNTFIGYISKIGTGIYDILQRYSDSSSMGLFAGNNGEGLSIKNNINIGVGSSWLNGSNPNLIFEEENNLLWVHSSDGERVGNTIYSVWRTGPPYTLRGYPNIFEDIGFRGTTPEYNYSAEGINPLFVNPGFYFGPIGNHADRGRYDLDFHPLINSMACNGFINGKVGIAIGGLPCVCTDNSQCVETFGSGSECNLNTKRCE
ncbi:MAG: archaellin/type IV pilin N-terminal domain-containing protein [Candidatus Pacearchaeota archaeon]